MYLLEAGQEDKGEAVRKALKQALAVCTEQRGFRCTRGWLEGQLGIPVTSLSQISSRPQAIAGYLHHERLLPLFNRGDFTLPERAAVEELAATVTEMWSGYRVRPARWSVPVALEAGLYGAEQFMQAPCGIAAGFLDRSWEVLRDQAPFSPVGFKVGAKLALWLAYQHRLDEAAEVTRKLAGHAKHHSGSSEDHDALATAHRAMAYVCRHRRQRPELAIGYATQANTYFRVSRSIPGEVAAMRDVLLALTGWSLGIGAEPDRQLREAIVHIVRDGERMVGGKQPKDGLVQEWLHFRLTVIECLYALGSYELATARWREFAALKPIRQWIRKEAPLIVRTKVDFVKPAYLFSEGEPEEAAKAAESYAHKVENKCFLDRRLRLDHFVRSTAAGDKHKAHAALVTTIIQS